MSPSFFTLHTFYWGDVHVENWGEEFAFFISPMAAAKEAGLRMSNHTDFSVTPMAPMHVMHSAMTRLSRSGKVIGPDQRVDAMTALKAMTIDAAWQIREEDLKGTLEVGKLADLVILDANPLTAPVELPARDQGHRDLQGGHQRLQGGRMTAPRLTVIGGYLGAGKTTLVNRLLAGATGERVAVIVNDFGSINIDAELIQSADKDTVRLSNGCMCCSASDGLAAALARLCARADEIDRIVIETSGVSEPGKVAKNAHGFRLPLDAVIVMADAEQLPAQASNRYVGDVVRRQLAQADLILLNKIDLVDPEALARAREVILSNAPGCPVAETTAANLPLVLLFASHGRQDRTDGHSRRSPGRAIGSPPRNQL